MSGGADAEGGFSGTMVESDAGERGLVEPEAERAAGMDAPPRGAGKDAAGGDKEDPDADLFADSGEAPDLSYLNAALVERPDHGVTLDLAGGPVPRTVAGFPVRAVPDEGGQGVLVLSGEVTIARGGDLRTALLHMLDSFAVVRIDMRAVAAADLTLVQVLQAAAVTARERGVDLAAAGPVSEAVIEAARRAGLADPDIRRVGLERLLPGEGA